MLNPGIRAATQRRFTKPGQTRRNFRPGHREIQPVGEHLPKWTFSLDNNPGHQGFTLTPALSLNGEG